MLNIPSPTTVLRTPDSPGHSGRNAASAATGSAKISGPDTPFTTTFLGFDARGDGPFGMASPSMFQFVAQVKPLSIVIGKPLVQRTMPDTFQPPITALSWWNALKSDSPRSDSGSQELMTMPPPFKSLPVPPVPS